MRSLHFSLLLFAPKKLPAPFLRRVPALARSPQLRDKLSRSDLWTKCPEVGSLRCFPSRGYSFSDGHSAFSLIPGVLWLVTAAVLFFYRISKRSYNRIMAELNAKKTV